jgi:hypothetical protein
MSYSRVMRSVCIDKNGQRPHRRIRNSVGW